MRARFNLFRPFATQILGAFEHQPPPLDPILPHQVVRKKHAEVDEVESSSSEGLGEEDEDQTATDFTNVEYSPGAALPYLVCGTWELLWNILTHAEVPERGLTINAITERMTAALEDRGVTAPAYLKTLLMGQLGANTFQYYSHFVDDTAMTGTDDSQISEPDERRYKAIMAPGREITTNRFEKLANSPRSIAPSRLVNALDIPVSFTVSIKRWSGSPTPPAMKSADSEAEDNVNAYHRLFGSDGNPPPRYDRDHPTQKSWLPLLLPNVSATNDLRDMINFDGDILWALARFNFLGFNKSENEKPVVMFVHGGVDGSTMNSDSFALMSERFRGLRFRLANAVYGNTQPSQKRSRRHPDRLLSWYQNACLHSCDVQSTQGHVLWGIYKFEVLAERCPRFNGTDIMPPEVPSIKDASSLSVEDYVRQQHEVLAHDQLLLANGLQYQGWTADF